MALLPATETYMKHTVCEGCGYAYRKKLTGTLKTKPGKHPDMHDFEM
jgi:hypothetical protein